ncbi:SGNH/GDSL hydrolase family protein [Pedobacter heparinus]|uniref:Lipolytic protein G-D-S-L family n=1 Tax=Pedobacter heparinus (strain ATCC 13125 / DSM 2366 / CIP 104194 / JCM 7457 / NBRC 12017 / NCIMB 9290 / NRRL B-14731 / HIM 762-3) TaxID=485917 RepID=C6XZ18_PEDHD|nr:GDSL-type esterase/lipase family protein [Pedobacter heparinus]ACU02500.1 lipolytic protein G-D-S-L family [Pedobacter heparinus DSM 2366]
MKRIKLLLLLPVLMMVLLFSAMNYKPKKVIFFGDSITQAGVKPGGYVDLIKKDLDPAKYEVIGAGIGGNKVYDLYLRMEEDVLNKKPDLVVIYIGVNDVWHKLQHRTGTDYPKFIQFYQALINKMQAKGIKVVLCTPAVIGEKKAGANEMDAELDKYAGAIRELAAKNNLPMADLRKIFTGYDQENNPENAEKGILTTDGVHLNEKGNRTLADTLLPLIK